MDTRAPDEEGTIVLYPFDPANASAREEAGVAADSGVVLEAFAYEPARERHRAFCQMVAAEHGWRVDRTRTAALNRLGGLALDADDPVGAARHFGLADVSCTHRTDGGGATFELSWG